MPSSGAGITESRFVPLDIYFAARLAFLDRPDVRLRTYDEQPQDVTLIEARSEGAVLAFAVDRLNMFAGPPWLPADIARSLRRHFDYYERPYNIDRILNTERVR